MLFENLIKKYNLTIPISYIPAFFTKIKEHDHELTQKITRTLGVGNWRMLLLTMNKTELTINSVCNDLLLLDFLKKVGGRNLKELRINLSFWYENTELKEVNELITYFTKQGFKVMHEKGEEDTSLKIKGVKQEGSLLTIKKIFKLMCLLLPYIYNINISFKSNNSFFNIKTTPHDFITVNYRNIPERDLLDYFNSLFKTKYDDLPVYALAYLKITKIRDNWFGKREGEIKIITGNH